MKFLVALLLFWPLVVLVTAKPSCAASPFTPVELVKFNSDVFYARSMASCSGDLANGANVKHP